MFTPHPQRIRPLAPGREIVRSETPLTHSVGNPSICVLPGGRLAVSFIHGRKERRFLPGAEGEIRLSDDHGQTWRKVWEHRLLHSRLFLAGGRLYLLGHTAERGIYTREDGTQAVRNGHKMGDLAVLRSDDLGQTWSEPSLLTHGERWHQAASNLWYKDGNVYLVMERAAYEAVQGWNVNELAPVLMRARETDDLRLPESWTFAKAPAYRDVAPREAMDYFGIPWYDTLDNESVPVGGGRRCAPMGWLETQVVQVVDPNHVWYDPQGKTLHLLMRAHCGRTGYACLMRVLEHPDGTMTTDFQLAPSGRRLFYLPLPGGQMKFYIRYDAPSGLYWLLSTQATDSMIRPDRMPPDRFGLPDNERQRLTLHVSGNLVDWRFVGLVDDAGHPKGSRHYASMDVDGEDLVIVSRSGDSQAESAHNGNLILFHRVENFRGLVY